MQRILVATDMTAGAYYALGRACGMARQAGAALRVLFAPPSSASDEECAIARRMLRDQVQSLAAAEGDESDRSVHVIRGEPSSVILEEARQFSPDIIILGAHGEPRLRDAIFGTTASHIAREAEHPVLIVQNDHHRPYLKVMAAVEEDTAEDVLDLACRIAPARELLVVHAHGSATESLLGYGDVLEDARADQQAMIGRIVERMIAAGASVPRIENIVEEGDVVTVLMKAWDEHRPNLVVMGTHGRTGLSWLLRGSVAETTMLGCPSDLLIVRMPQARRK